MKQYFVTYREGWKRKAMGMDFDRLVTLWDLQDLIDVSHIRVFDWDKRDIEYDMVNIEHPYFDVSYELYDRENDIVLERLYLNHPRMKGAPSLRRLDWLDEVAAF